MPSLARPVIDRLKAHTKIIGSCWLWTGTTDCNTGYGLIKVEGKMIGVHRVSAHIHHGLDLKAKRVQACHTDECPNKNCWNPEHVYVGNASKNKSDFLRNR